VKRISPNTTEEEARVFAQEVLGPLADTSEDENGDKLVGPTALLTSPPTKDAVVHGLQKIWGRGRTWAEALGMAVAARAGMKRQQTKLVCRSTATE
jgi:hypothetical protein